MRMYSPFVDYLIFDSGDYDTVINGMAWLYVILSSYERRNKITRHCTNAGT